MSVLVYLLLLALSGLIVGGLGRLLLPGPDPIGIGATIAVGLVASFVSGLVTWAIFGRTGGGFVLAVLVAVGLVYLLRRHREQSAAPPGR